MKKSILALICAVSILCTAVLFAGASTTDDSLTINDALNILKHLAKLEPLTNEQVLLYDFRNDGNISIDNALIVLKGLAKLTELPVANKTTNSATSSEEQYCAFDLRDFDTVEEVMKHIQNSDVDWKNGATNESVLSDILVPRNLLPGFELDHVLLAGGARIILYYTKTDYVYDEKLTANENYERSSMRFSIDLNNNLYLNDFSDEWVKYYFDRDGYKLLNFEDRKIYHLPYSYRDDGFIQTHGFHFIVNGRHIMATIPPIDGLDVYDMVKYLEMIPVVSKEQSE
jgi:hypothetical protein